MRYNFFILQSFRLFFRQNPVKLIILFFITLFLGFNQGITIVLLIPMLKLLDSSVTASSSNKLTEFLNTILNYTGLQISIEVILTMFAISLLLIAVLNYYKSILQASYQQEFSYAIRKRLFKKIITSDWAFLNGKSKHNHIQVLTTEIPKMTTYYYYYMGLASKVIFILAYVSIALIVSVKFTLIVILVGILVGFSLKKFIKNAKNIGNENIQSFRKMLKHIDDFWLTVKIAKVHNSEAFYYEKFNESNLLMLDHQYKQVKNKAIPEFLFTISGILSLIFIVYTSYNILHLPIDSLFVLILLFGRIFPQFIGINNDMNMLVSSLGSVKMVLELDREIIEREFETKKSIEKIELKDSLKIKNLNFSYSSNNPLFVNFSDFIPANKITGIVGKSGCGKTTLIDIIAGLQMSEDVILTVDDVVLNKEKLPVWRSELAYLPQDSFFIDGTIRENLIWDAEEIPADDQIFKVLKLVNADHLVSGQKQGLDAIIVNYQYHFSGGERQRLALARVLLRNPKLLLLDEATSSLDTENELLIMHCLAQLKNEMTIVFVTHRDSLRPFFDKIINFD